MTKHKSLSILTSNELDAYNYLMSLKSQYLKDWDFDYFSDGIKPVYSDKPPIDYIVQLMHCIYPSTLINFYNLINKKYQNQLYDTDFNFTKVKNDNILYIESVNDETVNTYQFNITLNFKNFISRYKTGIPSPEDEDYNSNDFNLNNLNITLNFHRSDRWGSDPYTRRSGIYESIRLVISNRTSCFPNFSIRFLYVDPRHEWNYNLEKNHPIIFNKLTKSNLFDIIPEDSFNFQAGNNDTWLYYESNSRIIDIISNTPLFTIDQIKLLYSIQLLSNTESVISYYEYGISHSSDISSNSNIPNFRITNQTILWLHQLLLKNIWFNENGSVQELLRLITNQTRSSNNESISFDEINCKREDINQNHPLWGNLPNILTDDNGKTITTDSNLPRKAWTISIDPTKNISDDLPRYYKFGLTSKLNNIKLPIDLVNQSIIDIMLSSFNYKEHLRSMHESVGDLDSFNEILNREPCRLQDYITNLNLSIDFLSRSQK